MEKREEKEGEEDWTKIKEEDERSKGREEERRISWASRTGEKREEERVKERTEEEISRGGLEGERKRNLNMRKKK